MLTDSQHTCVRVSDLFFMNCHSISQDITRFSYIIMSTSCTCYYVNQYYIFVNIILNQYYIFVHAPLRKVKLILVSRASTTLIKKIEALGPVPERPINPNPGLKFCSTFCIYLPMHCFKVTYFVILFKLLF